MVWTCARKRERIQWTKVAETESARQEEMQKTIQKQEDAWGTVGKVDDPFLP